MVDREKYNPVTSTPYTPETWREKWFNHGKDFKPPEWAMAREIRVERTSGVAPEVVECVLFGVDLLLHDIGLTGFKIRDFGEDAVAADEVKDATRPDGILDHNVLFETLRTEPCRDPSKGGTPHADIIITERRLETHDLGNTQMQPGAMIVSVPGNIQKDPTYVVRLSKHEAARLFGFDSLHKHIMYPVHGYPEVESCLMEYAFPTTVICDECKDVLTSLWQGVEARTGSKFLRTS